MADVDVRTAAEALFAPAPATGQPALGSVMITAIAAVVKIAGLLLGYALTWQHGNQSPAIDRGSIVTATAFGNAQGLPIVLVAAVCQQLYADQPKYEDLAISYIALYSISQNFLFWLCGPLVLKDELFSVLSFGKWNSNSSNKGPAIIRIGNGGYGLGKDPRSDTESPDSPAAHPIDVNAPKDVVGSESHEDASHTVAQAASSPTHPESRWKQLLHAAFQPPLVALAAAFIISSIGPLSESVLKPSGVLHVVWGAADAIGQAAVPVNMLLLGVRLAKGLDKEDVKAIGQLVIAGVCFSRLLVMPAIGLALHFLRKAMGWSLGDKMLCLVLLVECCTPTANNCLILARTLGKSDKSIAVLLFFQYCAAPLTLTLCIAIFLYVC
eukprot:jgi/Chlat1/8600/Chrsp86S00656